MFAKEVVRWCMVHGEARVVFAMEESGNGEWGKYMDEYWVEEEEQGGKCDAVAWLRDLGQARWGVAGTRLLREAKGAGDVGVKHVSVFVPRLFAWGGGYLSAGSSLCSVWASLHIWRRCRRAERWMTRPWMVRYFFDTGVL